VARRREARGHAWVGRRAIPSVAGGQWVDISAAATGLRFISQKRAAVPRVVPNYRPVGTLITCRRIHVAALQICSMGRRSVLNATVRRERG
jgi:hypothetical protein